MSESLKSTRFSRFLSKKTNVDDSATAINGVNARFKPPKQVKYKNGMQTGGPTDRGKDVDDVDSVISFSGSEKILINDHWLAQQDATKPAMSSGEKCSAFVSSQTLSGAGIMASKQSPLASVPLVAYTPSPSVTSSTGEVSIAKPSMGAKRSLNFENPKKLKDKETMICDNDDMDETMQKETSLLSELPSKKQKHPSQARKSSTSDSVRAKRFINFDNLVKHKNEESICDNEDIDKKKKKQHTPEGSACGVTRGHRGKISLDKCGLDKDTSNCDIGNLSHGSVECFHDENDKENYKQKGPCNKSTSNTEADQISTRNSKEHEEAEVLKGNLNTHSDSSSKLSPYQLARSKNIEKNNKELKELMGKFLGSGEKHNGRRSFKKPIEGDGSHSAEKSGTTFKTSRVSPNPSRSLRPNSSSMPKYSNSFEDKDTQDSEVETSSETVDDPSGGDSDSSSNNDSDNNSSISDAASDKTQGSWRSFDVDGSGGISSDDEEQPAATPPTTKKYAQNLRKNLRNSGQEYITSKGKVRAAREPKPIHECKRLKCSQKITKKDAHKICSEYWKQGSYEKRKLYIASRIEEIPKQRSRTRVPGSGRSKNKSCKYFLIVKKKRVQVCRDTFLKVLDETDSFVRRIVSKKTSTGTVHNDKRGKHMTKRKLSPQRKQQVLDHIALFPKYVSHYCRKQTSQRYLQSHLSVKIMHRDYKAKVSKPVSYWSYRRLFKTLKLKFKKPNKDTCAKCDSYTMKIKITTDNEEKEKLEKERELHKRKADAGYHLKRASREAFAADPSKRVLVFDLEQCLPTPLLRCSEVYYARQLYVFNLTIYDCSSKLTHCYMWHEGEGGRGANEIASCIFEHCLNNDNIPEEVKHVRLFSDSCAGQNKNSIVSAMFLTLLQEKPSLHKVDHVFLVPGHTRLECDNKHSVIERASRNCESLQVPSEWYSLVDIAGKTDIDKYPGGRFRVVEMRDKFYNFAALLSPTGPLVKRLNDEEGERFYYLKTFWFQYSKKNQFMVDVKSSFNENAHFSSVNFLRQKKHLKSGLKLTNVLSKLPSSTLISEKKKEDLLKLLKFISSEHHAFYKGLATSHEVSGDMDPDLPSDNSDDSDDSIDE